MENIYADLFAKRRFTKKQKSIAEYFIKSQYHICQKTLKKVADESGSSEVSILAFVRMLGFSGFSEFKDWTFHHIDVLQDEDEAGTRIDLEERMHSNARQRTGKSLLLDHMSVLSKALENSLLQNKPEKYEDVVTAILQAESVTVTGSRIASFSADRFAMLLQNVLPHKSGLVNCNRGIYHSMSSLGPNDVVIYICFARYHKVDKTICELVKSTGATLILICDSVLSPFALYADHLLTVSNESISFFNSEIGAVAIYEYIISLIMERLDEAERNKRLHDWQMNDNFFSEHRF